MSRRFVKFKPRRFSLNRIAKEELLFSLQWKKSKITIQESAKQPWAADVRISGGGGGVQSGKVGNARRLGCKSRIQSGLT